jgi:hypothetical protein
MCPCNEFIDRMTSSLVEGAVIKVPKTNGHGHGVSYVFKLVLF